MRSTSPFRIAELEERTCMGQLPIHGSSLTPSFRICRLSFVVLIVAAMSGCFGRFTGGSAEALKLETAMHQQMARGDVAGIYNEADQRYRDAVTRDKSDALYTSINRQAGGPSRLRTRWINDAGGHDGDHNSLRVRDQVLEGRNSQGDVCLGEGEGSVSTHGIQHCVQ